jgi:hypothetical protein
MGVERRIRLPSHTFDTKRTRHMTTVEALPFPTTLDEPARVAGVWLRRVLLFALIASGALLTLWILSHLGPVVYGLPAPFLRRAAA